VKSTPLKLWIWTVALSLLGVAMLAPGALAAPKEVAYRCDLDICLLDPDNPSAPAVNLTDNGATSYDEEPVWSPDGTKLAFVAIRNDVPPATPNIFVMDPNAPGQTINVATQVTHYNEGNVPLSELAWSPDGSKIAFVRGGGAQGSQPLWVTESNGTQATPLPLAAQGGGPTWSASGTQIAYWFSNQVYIKNSDGSGSATPLSGGAGREPEWSPDGSRIAMGTIGHPFEFLDLHILPAGGGAPTIVTSSTQFIFAAWSPSGSQIAYHETKGNESYFRVVNADGSGDHGLPIVQGLNANGPAPSWSPDGSRLVFHGYYFGDLSTEADNTDKIYIANSNGTGSVTSITGDDSHEPAWKPAKAVPPPPLPPLPGKKIKPKLTWFTKRIPWTGGYVKPLIVACGAKDCGVNSKATGKVSRAAGLPFRPLATSSAKAKPRTVVVAGAKMKVPAGKRKPVKLKLNKQGVALIRAKGKLNMKLTVTITIPGQKKVVKSKTVRLYIPKKK